MNSIQTAGNSNLVQYSDNFLSGIEKLRNAMEQERIRTSKMKTPADKIKKRGKYDTVSEDYFRAKLDELFIWTYEPMTQETIYSKHIVPMNGGMIEVQLPYAEKTLGILKIFDNGVWRSYPAPGWQEYMYRKNAPRTIDNLLESTLTVRGAWSKGLSFAANRLCRIADDIYRKTNKKPELRPDLLQKFQEIFAQSVQTNRISDVRKRIAEDYDNNLNAIPEEIAVSLINYMSQQ